RSLKDTGAGCSRMPKNKQEGKETGLAKQGPLAGSQEQKEHLLPLEEGILLEKLSAHGLDGHIL
ncbi:unnamed protein product, partial [Bubo scandiacus]